MSRECLCTDEELREVRDMSSAMINRLLAGEKHDISHQVRHMCDLVLKERNLLAKRGLRNVRARDHLAFEALGGEKTKNRWGARNAQVVSALHYVVRNVADALGLELFLKDPGLLEQLLWEDPSESPEEYVSINQREKWERELRGL